MTASSPIVFTLDPSSGVPTYLQLVPQVEHALRLGYGYFIGVLLIALWMRALAFAGIGFSGDFGSHYFLHKLVGTAKARELYYTAEELREGERCPIHDRPVEHMKARPHVWPAIADRIYECMAKGPRAS